MNDRFHSEIMATFGKKLREAREQTAGDDIAQTAQGKRRSADITGDGERGENGEPGRLEEGRGGPERRGGDVEAAQDASGLP